MRFAADRDVVPPPSTVRLGQRGERVARRELERRGYAILATRYRSRFGEIDIICRHRGVLVFVEVKARRSDRHGRAVEAVPRWKQRRIAAMALDYLRRRRGSDPACRFDVVAIDGFETAAQTVQVIEGAFTLDHS